MSYTLESNPEASDILTWARIYLVEHPEGFYCAECRQLTGMDFQYHRELSLICRACWQADQISYGRNEE